MAKREMAFGLGARWEPLGLEDGMTVKELRAALAKFPDRAVIYCKPVRLAVRVQEGRSARGAK